MNSTFFKKNVRLWGCVLDIAGIIKWSKINITNKKVEIIFFNGKNVDFYSVLAVEIETMAVWMEIC